MFKRLFLALLLVLILVIPSYAAVGIRLNGEPLGAAGDEVTIIFTTVGVGDEIITFHATLVSSTDTLTLAVTADRYYVVRFISNGARWFEVSRTAIQT